MEGLDLQHDQALAAPAIVNSRLATLALVGSFLLPVAGAPLNLALAFAGLRQIRRSGGLVEGEGTAKLAIFLSVLQLLVAGGGWQWLSAQRAKIGPASDAFVAALASGSYEAAKPVIASGLQPRLDARTFAELERELAASVGPFSSAAPAPEPWPQLSARIVWPLTREVQFAKGPPVKVELLMVDEYDAMRVQRVRFSSPLLQRPIDLTGESAKELDEWSGPKSPAAKIKSFK